MGVMLTTATIASADTVHALPGAHLGDNYVPALLEPFADARGVVEGDGCIVPRSSSDSWDRQVVAINEDRISISAM